MLFRTCRSQSVVNASASAVTWEGYWCGLGLHGVGRCGCACVVPDVDNGGRAELYVSADEGMSESVSVGVHTFIGGPTRTCQQTNPPRVFRWTNTEDVVERGQRRAGGLKCVRYVLQSPGGYFKTFANLALLAFSTTFYCSRCFVRYLSTCANVYCTSSSLCSTHAQVLHPRRHPLAGGLGPPRPFSFSHKLRRRVAAASRTRS
jgi:hypothetical protein